MALLEFKNVSYVYDDKSILKNVSFGITQGILYRLSDSRVAARVHYSDYVAI